LNFGQKKCGLDFFASLGITEYLCRAWRRNEKALSAEKRRISMSKISMEWNSKNLPEELALIPTGDQRRDAFMAALFTIKLIKELANFLEVIKIEFNQHSREDGERSILTLRFNAIFSHYLERDKKLEVEMPYSLEEKVDSRQIALDLHRQILDVVSARIRTERHVADTWHAALNSAAEKSSISPVDLSIN
jgi:hypothetical protein